MVQKWDILMLPMVTSWYICKECFLRATYCSQKDVFGPVWTRPHSGLVGIQKASKSGTKTLLGVT